MPCSRRCSAAQAPTIPPPAQSPPALPVDPLITPAPPVHRRGTHAPRRVPRLRRRCRRKVQAPTAKELKADPGKAETFRRDQRGIVVKRFDEVPVADVEIVFPDKTVGLKLLDLLTLYGTALGAFIGGVTAFFGAQLELSYVLSTLGVVGGKLFQVISPRTASHSCMSCMFLCTSLCGPQRSMRHVPGMLHPAPHMAARHCRCVVTQCGVPLERAARPVRSRLGPQCRGVVRGGCACMQTYTKMEAKKAEMMKQMSQKVFDISMDAQEGAIYSVLDEMADQYVKEILLAYFLLVKYKYPATEVRPLLLRVCHAPSRPFHHHASTAAPTGDTRPPRSAGSAGRAVFVSATARTRPFCARCLPRWVGRHGRAAAACDSARRVQGELDEVCEAFLEDKFDVRIDFAIEESMPRLRMYGLVDSMPDPDDPRFKAPDLETAHQRLIQRWQRSAPPPRPPLLPLCLSTFVLSLHAWLHAWNLWRSGYRRAPCNCL